MIITISGLHGTGKSSVAKEVAKEFNLRYIGAGDVFRQMAKEKKMSLVKFSEFVAQNPEIDKEIDRRTIDEAKKGNIIVEGSLASWKTREISTIDILLTANERIRIERIALRENCPFEKIKEETLTREKIELDRFKKLYNIDIRDYSIYDMVLNTTLWTEKSVIQIMITLIKEYLKSNQNKN